MTIANDSAHSSAPRGRGARLRWLVPLAFLGLVGWLLVRTFDALDLPEMQRTLLDVPTMPALGVALLALLAVACTGLVDVVIARWLGIGVPAPAMLRLAFIANAFANVLNLSGAVGSGVRLLGLSTRKVPLPAGAALIGLQVLSLPLGLSLLIVITLASGSLPPTPGTTTRWLALAVLVAAALYLPAFFVLTARRRLMRWLPHGMELPPMRLKLALAGLSLLDWVLSAAVLYGCLFIAGAHVKPGLLLGSFAAAQTLGLLSLIPGGFGVFDGLMLLALTSGGYDNAQVLAGLFLFRIVYYLVPLLAGLYVGSGLLVGGLRVPALARAATRLRTHPLFGVLGLPASLLADLGMRALAVLTFGAGLMLLASAAIPAVHEHIEVVRTTLPLAAVESSYWLSVLTGVLLLGLGRGIDGRLRVAYRLAQPLLLLGALLAVTKGLHYGEAALLLSIALLLRLHKHEFTQRAMSLTSATTFSWLAGLAVVVLAFFAIGVAAVLGDGSFDLWYFGFGEHSSRIGRGLFAAALGVAAYLTWQALAVRRPPLRLPDHVELERARAVYLAHGGGEFAHLTFMGDKHLFWSDDGHATVAYGAVRDRLVALGSPCGPTHAIKRAILDFRQFADAQDRVPVFYEVLEPDLSLYHDLGFDLFKLGELATLRLEDFTLAGKRWEDLRQAVNRSAREQLAFELHQPPFDTVLMSEIERVSDAWLADRGMHEKRFSLGRFDPDYLAWSPLALVRRAGVVVAFANVLPPYGPGGTASVDLMRHVDDAPRGTMDFLFARVMQWAREQGYERFSLGMAPLSAVGDNPYARINERLAALAFQYGGRFYNYQGLRRYKEKFAPDWTGAYLAYPRGLWVPGLLIDIAALVAGSYRRFLVSRR
ncbi:MAG: bifunctional lysylphosphatidylglycerol flippase/synthetase MprF [Rhodanobacteraceae bacterium]|jgi:phosphatidylglycerol lysyltransferase|nr:bifunctional lysylphosphatidylglycerol flippase/synthetase MprF [Rhodanobacteraceae bacterium]